MWAEQTSFLTQRRTSDILPSQLGSYKRNAGNNAALLTLDAPISSQVRCVCHFFFSPSFFSFRDVHLDVSFFFFTFAVFRLSSSLQKRRKRVSDYIRYCEKKKKNVYVTFWYGFSL